MSNTENYMEKAVEVTHEEKICLLARRRRFGTYSCQ